MANTLTFANLTLTDANIFGGINYTVDLNAGDEFSIGNTASACVTFTTDTQVPKYSKDSTNGVFVWDIDGTDKGRFYITEVKKNNGMYAVTAYDAMYLTEKNISALSLTLPITVSACASAIATYIGCTISGTVKNGTLTAASLDEDMTIRELLGRVAEASGCSVKIDGSDHLCFMYYADSGITVTASEYIELEVADYTCAAIDNVTIYNMEGEVQASAGSGTNSLFIGQNPFLENATSTNATNIYNAVKDFAYAPLTCSMFEENGLEVGTIATFGTTPTLVMHLESGEGGAVVSSVGSDTRAEYNKDIMTTINETREIAVSAQSQASAAATAAAAATTAAGQAQSAASAAQTQASAAASAASAAQSQASAAASAASSASSAASAAQTSANKAQASADNAGEYAARALGNLSSVQSVAETLAWVTQHGTMTLTTDTAPDPSHVYFVVDANGDYVVGGTHYSVVTEPDVADISTYYELSINESLNNYVATHLVVDSEGLWIIPDAGGNKVLIATGQGTVYQSAGTYIVSGSDILAEFTADGAQIGQTGESRLNMNYRSLQLKDRDGYTYFHVSELLDENGNITEESTLPLPPIHDEVIVNVGFDISAIVEVLADGVDVTSDTTFNQKSVTIANVTEPISNLVITYTPYSPSAWYNASYFKAYTLGVRSKASGGYVGGMSTVIGYTNDARGFASLAEGQGTTASGECSHAEGCSTVASGDYSHSQNYCTEANYDNQTAIGKFNDNQSNNAFEIGNGTSDSARSNAVAVKWDGNVHIDLAGYQTTGNVDKDIYDALVSLGWDSDVIV